MTDLDLLIEFWETYLELYPQALTPNIAAKVHKTITFLRELKNLKGE